jgi:hypothetical protein
MDKIFSYAQAWFHLRHVGNGKDYSLSGAHLNSSKTL